ncbi:hypothetical protein H8B15_12975 [Hymenobacter sp. BT507]|uniref:STAS/SEC14 domain-containing protein n=1 Tax=Hymenobacter citatus TaxID=2763506 RepID=A0ABR7MLC0_9BACT|nr:hypothetical protein [Hymenobacter citatus]MBC6611841.1 hypothetical protein [Hymenobacter citatus]
MTSASPFGASSSEPSALCFQNSQAQVEWLADSYIHVRWTGQPMNSAEFRAVFRYIQALLIITQASLVLTDHREMLPPSPADVTWLMHDWTPTVVRETNYSHRAIIPARNSQTRAAIAKVTACDASAALTAQFFTEVEPAVRWLRSIYVV